MAVFSRSGCSKSKSSESDESYFSEFFWSELDAVVFASFCGFVSGFSSSESLSILKQEESS